ncbi:hypothetical protein JCM15519_25750 [Fundidesulfovibrio butyratiphilus]
MTTSGLPTVLPRDIRLLSLDIFDTALRRSFSQPDHVFCQVQEELAGQGFILPDFARIRRQAERQARQTARQAHGVAETSLASIYSHVQVRTGWAPWLLEKAKEIEIAVERACVTADPLVLDLFRRARGRRLPVVFVSDMYLPRPVIEAMLLDNGYEGFLEVFLSSERLTTKGGDGGLFRAVLDTFELAAHRVLHIGDNLHADAAMPERLGIRHAVHDHRRLAMAKTRPLERHILPLSRLKASHWPSGLAETDSRRFFDFLGRTHGPILHGSLVAWIAQCALQNRHDLVLFFSRDGHLLKRIYDRFRAANASLPPSAYCCVSRYTLCMANIVALDEKAFTFLLSGTQPKTVRDFLTRTGVRLAPDRLAEVLDRHGLRPDDVVNRDAASADRMCRLLSDIEIPLRLEFARHRANLDAYLSRFDFKRFRNIAAVDLGWAGSLQASFTAALQRLGFAGDIAGYYLGLLDCTNTHRRDGRVLHGFLEHAMTAWHEHVCQNPKLFSPLGPVILMEMLHAAPHGGVCGYESRFGRFRPRFADNPEERRQYDEKLSVYQAAVLEALAPRDMDDPMFSPAACQEAILDLARDPGPIEAAILGDLVHFDAVEHVGDGMPLAVDLGPDPSVESIYSGFERSYWKSGFLVRNRLASLERGLVRLDRERAPAAPVGEAPAPRTSSRGSGMKLLVISHDFTRTGAPLLLLHWLRWLGEHTDIELRILSLWGGELLGQFEELGPVLSFHGDIAPPGLDRQESLRRLEAFCGGPVDAVFGNTTFCAEAYDLLASLDAPIVTYVHELEYVLRTYVGQDRLDALFAYTDHYIAGSVKVKDNLVARHALPPERIDVVEAFFAPTVSRDQIGHKAAKRRALGLPMDATIVLGCGYAEWRKGTDLFVEVARMVRGSTRSPVLFCWIGGKSPAPDLDYALLGMDDPDSPVRFLGAKANYKDYLLASDLFLLASREDYSSLAGMEAYECGSPAVCFAGVGEFCQLITPDIGVVVDFEDTRAMARAVTDLIADPVRLRDKGLAGRKKILSCHVVDNAGPRLLGCLRRLLASGPAKGRKRP